MESFRQFYQFLNKFVVLQQDEFDRIISPVIQFRSFNKKEIISNAGDVEQYLNFVSKGLVRKYFRKGDDEVITQISLEDQIIHSQESFHSQTPSDYCIEAIEPSTLFSISYSDLDKIFSTGAAMERMGRRIVTFTLVLTERWQMSLLKLSPRERFLSFVKNNPELMQRTPQKFLASLLNIQPETFSRFKHLIKASSQSPAEEEENQNS
jgi:CRP-like cAMP-binding protein